MERKWPLWEGPPSFCQQYHSMTSWGQRKTPPTDSPSSVKDEYNDPRCHLASRPSRALCGIQPDPRQLTYAHTSQYTWLAPFPAPSAAHLTMCFSPNSQHRGFSVQASLPLFPRQRFIYLTECSIPWFFTGSQAPFTDIPGYPPPAVPPG